jgi:hypothetical protein
MARFGRDLVRSLTQPAFSRGLQEVGMLAGSLPARKEEEKRTARLEKGLFGLEQMAASGELTPEMYQEAMGSYTNMMTDDASAQKIRESMNRVRADIKSTAQFEAGVEINNIREKMYDALNDNQLPQAERDRRLRELQVEANEAAKQGRVDPMQVGNLMREVAQNVFQRTQQKKQAERVAQSHQITLDEATMRVERFDRWKAQGWFEDLQMEVQGNALRDQQRASEIRSSGMTKEQFLAKYGQENSYLYEQVQEETLLRRNRIAEATAESKKKEFGYSKKDLAGFGFTEAEANYLKDTATPKDAHAAVIKRIAQIPKATKPNAAMVQKIADALLNDVMTKNDLKYRRTDDIKEGEAIASRLAFKVQELMSKGKTFDVAMSEAVEGDSGAEGGDAEDSKVIDVDDTQEQLVELMKKLQDESGQ